MQAVAHKYDTVLRPLQGRSGDTGAGLRRELYRWHARDALTREPQHDMKTSSGVACTPKLTRLRRHP